MFSSTVFVSQFVGPSKGTNLYSTMHLCAVRGTGIVLFEGSIIMVF